MTEELQIDDNLAKATDVAEREVAAEAGADEDLSTWLLPKYSVALRRMWLGR